MKAFVVMAAAAMLSLPQTEEGRLELRALFERARGVLGAETETHSVTTTLLVARIGADGKVVMAEVDDEKSAQRFFTTPVEKLDTKQQKNER
jgi:hypothetical protein